MVLQIFNIVIAIIVLVIPLIMIYYPPKSINGLYGYRTLRSMENQKNWDLAQEYSAKLLLKFSVVTIVFQIVLIFF